MPAGICGDGKTIQYPLRLHQLAEELRVRILKEVY
jgi:hypothetical protein